MAPGVKAFLKPTAAILSPRVAIISSTWEARMAGGFSKKTLTPWDRASMASSGCIWGETEMMTPSSSSFSYISLAVG